MTVATDEQRSTSVPDRPGGLALFFFARGGGVQASAVLLADRLARRGIDVDLILPRAQGPYLRDVRHPVRIVDLRTASNGRLIWRLAGYLRRARPALLVASQHHSGVYGMLAKRLAGSTVPAALILHTPLSRIFAEEASWRSRLAALAMRRTYPRFDAIVGVSRGVVADLSRWLPVAEPLSRMIPCPVPIAAVRQAAAEPSTETWLAAKDRPVYVAVARLSPEKDLATLLDAFALLRQQRRARLVVLGEGGERGALERRAHRLGIADDVRLPGWLDNPYPLMQRADAVVVSSRREGFCRVLVEGLALGVPVISTDCPCGPREILDGGRLGTLVPVGDADALARAMHDVAAERAPMPVVGDDELAAYDVEAVTDQFAALFEELVPSASRNSLRSPR